MPRWKPSFITALVPEDRCHLNGICVRDGEIRYVAALGETNSVAGWRENRRHGGIVIDIKLNEVMTRGLSLPHSPRWHNGKLWLLESGKGSLGIIDERSGKYQEVCRLPGFTRGLEFSEQYAFVGLSQLRESAGFGVVPAAGNPHNQDRCGVWIVDLKTGRAVDSLTLNNVGREIFSIQVLQGLRRPEIVINDENLISNTYELPKIVL